MYKKNKKDSQKKLILDIFKMSIFLLFIKLSLEKVSFFTINLQYCRVVNKKIKNYPTTYDFFGYSKIIKSVNKKKTRNDNI